MGALFRLLAVLAVAGVGAIAGFAVRGKAVDAAEGDRAATSVLRADLSRLSREAVERRSELEALERRASAADAELSRALERAERAEANARRFETAMVDAERRATRAVSASEPSAGPLAPRAAAGLDVDAPSPNVEELRAARMELAAATERERALELDLEAAREAQAELDRSLAERAEQLSGLARDLEAARVEARAAMALRRAAMLLDGEGRLDALLREADALWPARPERIEAYRAWIERAGAELAALPDVRDTVLELGHLATEGDPHAVWIRERLADFAARLEAVGDPLSGSLAGFDPDRGWGIERRLAFAESLTILDADAAWREAALELAADPRFDGVELSPIPGMVPLGRDRSSGLQEFAVLATGTTPARDTRDRLVLSEESAAVLVLTPGGADWIGAQSSDRSAPNHDRHASADDGPVQRVELSPFLIGKHELNQAQWERLTGARPSRYGPGRWGDRDVDRTHALTDVSWDDARRVLARHALRLPTEAEWELAARAGSDGPWWTGEAVRSLDGAVNLADAWAAEHGGGSWGGHLRWLDDGHTVAAPVADFRPNPFGLHNVHGNVWEWCQDSFAPRQPLAGDATRDPLFESPTTTLRVIRGGAYNSNALEARSGHRASSPRERAGASLGVRLARSLDLD
ncbi:MAG: SUMF1/EgtB/PvdO family nonheme iron enzyme [Planctomycetota bacterium]